MDFETCRIAQPPPQSWRDTFPSPSNAPSCPFAVSLLPSPGPKEPLASAFCHFSFVFLKYKWNPTAWVSAGSLRRDRCPRILGNPSLARGRIYGLVSLSTVTRHHFQGQLVKNVTWVLLALYSRTLMKPAAVLRVDMARSSPGQAWEARPWSNRADKPLDDCVPGQYLGHSFVRDRAGILTHKCWGIPV